MPATTTEPVHLSTSASSVRCGARNVDLGHLTVSAPDVTCIDCLRRMGPSNLAKANDLEARVDIRARAAELLVLDRFDTLRSKAGHDYGAGQRARELRALRRELEGYGLRLAEEDRTVVEPLTAGELLASFRRIASVKRDRIRREDYRRSTPATQRTLRTWDRLENELTIASGLEEKNQAEHAGEQWPPGNGASRA